MQYTSVLAKSAAAYPIRKLNSNQLRLAKCAVGDCGFDQPCCGLERDILVVGNSICTIVIFSHTLILVAKTMDPIKFVKQLLSESACDKTKKSGEISLKLNPGGLRIDMHAWH